MKKYFVILTLLIFVSTSCTHFVPIHSSEVFSKNYKLVSKIKFKNENELEIVESDSNLILLQDSILVITNDSTKINISDKEVSQYYKSEFSFGRTAALATGIILIPTALAYVIFLNLYEN